MNIPSLFFHELISGHPIAEQVLREAPEAVEELNAFLFYSVLLSLLPSFPQVEHYEVAAHLADREDKTFLAWYNTLTGEQQRSIQETVERALLTLKTI